MADTQLRPDLRFIGDQHCRVTVVGPHRRVDLAVPANAPIAEYVMPIARLCTGLDDDLTYGADPQGEPDEATLPPAWSLALTGSGPLPPESSLADLGITDGQVLYLRDAGLAEADIPVVTDIDESVADAAGRIGWAWTSGARSATYLGTGAIWLVGTLAAFGILADRMPGSAPRLLAALGIVAAILSVVLAGLARQRSWPLPSWLRTVLAASAIPEIAAAGALLTSAHAAPPQIAVAAAVGGACGALLALAACPGPVTGGFLAAGVLSLAVAVLLAGLHADGIESAGVVAVAALWLYDLAPVSVAWLVAQAAPRGTGPVAGQVDGQVRQAQLLVTVWQTVLAVTAALALSWLAGSSHTFAYALACCVSVAMLLTASGYRQLGGVLPGVAAGLTGLLAVLLLVPDRLNAPWWTGPVICVLIAVALLGSGMTGSFADEAVPEPAAWRGPLATLLRVVSIPLLVGVFGAFGHLVTVGRGL
jgi:WXG100 protein secretion system (Wss), protein YukD